VSHQVCTTVTVIGWDIRRW